MPLFGSSHKHDNVDSTHGTNKLQRAGGPTGVDNTNNYSSNVAGGPTGIDNTNYSNAPGTGTAHLSGMAPTGQHTGIAGQGQHTGITGQGQHTGIAGQGQHTGMAGTQDPNYAYQTGAGNNSMGMNDNTNTGMNTGVGQTGGLGQQTGYGAGNNTVGGNLPPAGSLQHNANQTKGGHSMTGKVEHAVGALVGSSALKAKGLEKQQEAANIKLQTQEIAEAERLESEARMRRERAVAHGAHPDNAPLGSSGQHGHTTGIGATR